MKIIFLLVLLFLASISSKKSLTKHRKKQFVQIPEYNLNQIGTSHTGGSSFSDRSATAMGQASEFSRIPPNHPILTVISINIITSGFP